MQGFTFRLSGFFLTLLLTGAVVRVVATVLSLLKEARRESSIFIKSALMVNLLRETSLLRLLQSNMGVNIQVSYADAILMAPAEVCVCGS